jgi:PAS domain S-box-containing protein
VDPVFTGDRSGGIGITESKIGDTVLMASSRKPSQQALAEVVAGSVYTDALIRAPDGRAPRILVGESDPDTRERLQRVLASAGCRVETASDGRAAFAAALNHPPDLVIAEATLPRRHGYSLLRQLRGSPTTCWLPIILLSAEADEAAKQEALDAGADDYLGKPFGARELLSRIGLHLAMARVGREANEAVRASERRLGEVLSAVGEAVYAMDRDQRILFANRKALELWNRRADEVVGQPLLDAFPGIEHGEPYRAYQQVLAAGAPIHLETVAPAMANRWIGLDVHPAPEGGLVVAFRDIDERKRAEARLKESEERLRETNELLERRVAERTAELEAANRRLAAQIEERERAEAQLRQAQRIEAVGQLTSGVAHDFNNLLTAVIGNLELLETRLGKTDDHSARLLAAAEAAAERGARLTAQLLAFSRQQRMSPEPVDLNRVVDAMGELLQSTIGATTSIETRLSPDLWPALADSSQIELVLLNLAINARDAMAAPGKITIETANVTLAGPERPEEPRPGDYVMVSVTDTGNGIPQDILDKVFDPFFTTKEVGKGSGLGLSQVLGVAQQLGGGVRIETRPGEGTVVRVYLPRVRTADAQPERGPAPSHDAAVDGTRRADGAVILLVDDDSDVRAVAAAILREAGHEVIEAGSGGGALDRLDRDAGQIELMIADIAMPGMSGIELARAARNRRPDLPVLFVTGFASATVPLEDAPPEQILRKPFRASQLMRRVTRALEEKCTPGHLAPFS